ncbi:MULTISPECIES: hypothetical protein [Levilactobacillus]|uniref:hypothetical protein n=1 Tax=Levilactobacillus TaxID=2767886 RepID=UPI0019524BE1|nr:hypothetical protein [Levilactobacillus sp. 244-2]
MNKLFSKIIIFFSTILLIVVGAFVIPFSPKNAVRLRMIEDLSLKSAIVANPTRLTVKDTPTVIQKEAAGDIYSVKPFESYLAGGDVSMLSVSKMGGNSPFYKATYIANAV